MHRIHEELFPDWTGKSVYIVGGGPSLRNFNWELLRGKNIIAINRAFQVVPWAQLLYWMDKKFYDWYRDEIKMFKGLKITSIPPDNPEADIIILEGVQRQGIDMRPGFIARSRNSGAGAINLALKTGATRIYLLGIDLQNMDDNTHWHSGYKEFGFSVHSSAYTIMQYDFWEIKKAVEEELPDICIYNTSPVSKLTAFPMYSLSQALDDQL